MLYLIRHGQTAYNVARRYQGALDSPLTSLGESQAVMAGRRLATLVPRETPIVAGPLGRAQRTAELIKHAGGFTGPILTEPRITEITLGRWDGMTDEEIEVSFPRPGRGPPASTGSSPPLVARHTPLFQLASSPGSKTPRPGPCR
jgi:broad specificity phosphatase PhoE